MEYYSAREKLLIHAMAWMNLGNIRAASHKDHARFHEMSRIGTPTGTQSRSVVTRSGGGGEGHH